MQQCSVELVEDSYWMCGDCSIITFIITTNPFLTLFYVNIPYLTLFNNRKLRSLASLVMFFSWAFVPSHVFNTKVNIRHQSHLAGE